MFTNPIRYREKTITVVGAPFALGQPRPGVDQGPDYLRRAGLIKELKEQGWHVEDSGDVSMQSAKYVRTEAGDKTIQYGSGETNGSAPNGESWKEHRAEAVSQACRLLSIAVNKPAREDKFTLTVGGDHSIAIGSISGILRAQPETRVIWVDAHADINTPETTETGNIHGMPVAYLMGIVNSPCFEWLKTGSEELGGAPVKLLPQRIAYIGLRDVDKGELELLKQFNITTFTMIDVDRLGIQEVIRRAVEAVDPEGDSPLHLSFDIDGLDSSVAASTGTPVVGGLSYREGRYICEYLGATNRLISMDMVEVNPTLRPEHARTTARVGIQMIAGAVKPKTDRRSWAFKRPMASETISRLSGDRPRIDVNPAPAPTRQYVRIPSTTRPGSHTRSNF